MGGPPAWMLGVGRGVTTPHRKKYVCYERDIQASELQGFFG
jgi:hypothetical protein